MKKKATKVTLDHLASMVQRGFDGMGGQFGEINKKVDDLREEMHEEFKLVHDRIDALEVEILDIKKKLENVVYRREFETLRDRLEAVEREVALLKKK